MINDVMLVLEGSSNRGSKVVDGQIMLLDGLNSENGGSVCPMGKSMFSHESRESMIADK